MSRHVIRLHAAWDPPTAAGQPWRRSFGRPGGLAAADRVWLVLEGPAACVVVLNGERLPSVTAGVRWEVDVTHLLRERNDLAATFIPGTPDRAGSGRQPLPVACGRPALEVDAASRA